MLETNYSSIEITPVSLFDVRWLDMLKDNLRLDGDEQDSYLEILIDASIEAVEGLLHRTILDSEVVQSYDTFLTYYELLCCPVVTFTSLEFVDDSGAITPVDVQYLDWDIKSVPARLKVLDTFSIPENISKKYSSVIIKYNSGWTDLMQVPKAIRHAVIMVATDLYEHSESNTELKLQENRTLQHLLAKWDLPYLGVK